MSPFGIAGVAFVNASAPPAPPVDDLYLENLVLFLDSDDVTTGDTTWQSRASAGSSGGVLMDPYGALPPMAIAPTTATSGKELRVFNPTVGLLQGGLRNDTDAGLLGLGGSVTKVFYGRYLGSQDSPLAPGDNRNNGTLITGYPGQWCTNANAAGYVFTGGNNASVNRAQSISALVPGDQCVVVTQWDITLGFRVKVNGGAWSTWETPTWLPSSSAIIFMGLDPTYGGAFSFELGRLWMSNALESDPKIEHWENLSAYQLGITL